jgi:hypothetical protein
MATVTPVSAASEHGFTKPTAARIRLVAGLGVEGDAHLGRTVQHRSRIARDPAAPNLRQVHLMHSELHDEHGARGFAVSAGDLGENVTTRGLDLLGLPAGARLRLGAEAVVQITGVRKAGVMGTVLAGGDVRPGDPIAVELPPPHRPLDRV